MIRILIAESKGFSPEAAQLLRQVGEVTLADLDRTALEKALPHFDVLWVRLRNHIDARLLGSSARLKMIATPTTGLTHIDLEAAEERGVEILSLRGATGFLRTIRGTAEHTIGLMLALLRGLPAATAHVAAGGWNRNLFQGREIYGRTVGIVGYGRLGRIVARYLNAFEARVLVTDRPDWCGSVDPFVEMVSLPDLLAASDIVSLHVNLCPETHGFFGRNCFAAMRSGAYFLNTARGELVDEEALLEALESGSLAGAALDVLAGEPLVDAAQHPLVQYARRHSNLILTPHIGGCTKESMEKTEIYLAGQLVEAFSCVSGRRAE
jgi:D-3-phosphoglycerate dehydrogenase / 2-oxoglutarate reductase